MSVQPVEVPFPVKITHTKLSSARLFTGEMLSSIHDFFKVDSKLTGKDRIRYNYMIPDDEGIFFFLPSVSSGIERRREKKKTESEMAEVSLA